MSGAPNVLDAQYVPNTCRLFPMIASLGHQSSAGEWEPDEGAVLWAGHPGVGGAMAPFEGRIGLLLYWSGKATLEAGRIFVAVASLSPRGHRHPAETQGAGLGKGMPLGVSLGTGLTNFLWSEGTGEHPWSKPLKDRADLHYPLPHPRCPARCLVSA